MTKLRPWYSYQNKMFVICNTVDLVIFAKYSFSRISRGGQIRKFKYLCFVKSPTITNSQKSKHAKMKWKWNVSDFRPLFCTYRQNWARRTSWGWWDEWDDTGFEIQTLEFWGRARYLSVTGALHNTEFTSGWGRNIFASLQTSKTGNLSTRKIQALQYSPKISHKSL